MHVAAVLLTALVAAAPAVGAEPEPVVRDCSSRQYGDLGRDWSQRAVLAGPLAFVGMRGGYRAPARAAPVGRAWPLKVLVVVEPGKAVTVTIGARSRPFAALGYNALRHRGTHVPLSAGSPTVRFEACARPNPGRVWNRGTQFGGYFLLARPACVDVEMSIERRPAVVRRTLRFGRTRCVT